MQSDPVRARISQYDASAGRARFGIQVRTTVVSTVLATDLSKTLANAETLQHSGT